MPFDPELYKNEDEIDRAYHPMPRDDAWKRVTLEYIAERGVRLRLGCCGCQRWAWAWPKAFADQHGLDMRTPLLTVERRIRCTTCKARIIKISPENYSIEHDVLGKPRE